MSREQALRDNRKPTPFNGTAVRAKDLPAPTSGGTSFYGGGLPQRSAIPAGAESFGKRWGGNVGPKATAGQGAQGWQGKVARDKGPWGGNVGPHVTSGKSKVGGKGP